MGIRSIWSPSLRFRTQTDASIIDTLSGAVQAGALRRLRGSQAILQGKAAAAKRRRKRMTTRRRRRKKMIAAKTAQTLLAARYVASHVRHVLHV